MESANTLSQYPFLAELGISDTNLGCYRDGEWVATDGGEVTSINPHNQKPIATTKLGSLQNYEECITAMQSERSKWAKLPAP